MNTQPKISKSSGNFAWIGYSAAGIIAVWFFFLLAFIAISTCSLKPGESFISAVGDMGDSFGIFNALTSSLAAVFAAAGIFLQRKQFDHEIRSLQEQRIEEMVIRSSEHLPAFEINVSDDLETDFVSDSLTAKFCISVTNSSVIYNLHAQAPLAVAINGREELLSKTYGKFPYDKYPSILYFSHKGKLSDLLATGGVHLTISYTLENGVQVVEHFNFAPGISTICSNRIAQIGAVRKALVDKLLPINESA